MMHNKNICYTLKDEVAIEDFDDESLLLLCEQLRMVRLNSVARDILSLLDGKRTIHQVTEELAHVYRKPLDEILPDVRELLANLEAEGVVKPLITFSMKGSREMSDIRYLANPDVSCREEGTDGVILFNPDTDAVLVINPTGLVIWQALAQARTKDDIVANLMEICEDVPPDQVITDVNEFIDTLESRGFIGKVLEDNNH